MLRIRAMPWLWTEAIPVKRKGGKKKRNKKRKKGNVSRLFWITHSLTHSLINQSNSHIVPFRPRGPPRALVSIIRLQKQGVDKRKK